MLWLAPSVQPVFSVLPAGIVNMPSIVGLFVMSYARMTVPAPMHGQQQRRDLHRAD